MLRVSGIVLCSMFVALTSGCSGSSSDTSDDNEVSTDSSDGGQSNNGTSNGNPADNRASAIGSVRVIITAQAQYRSAGMKDSNNDGNSEYGTLKELSSEKPPFIDSVIASGQKNNYKFTLTLSKDALAYSIIAEPTSKGAGTHSFYADDAGVITEVPYGETPTKDSPVIQ